MGRLKSYFIRQGIFVITFLIFLLAILIIFYGIKTVNPDFEGIRIIEDFYANFGTEFISIAITVFILNELYIRRGNDLTRAKSKVDLVNRMRSQVNIHAKMALEQLAIEEYLYDGSLENENFSNGNLHQARFDSYYNDGIPSLKGVNFRGAILTEAWLNFSDLRQADLRHARIEKAHCFKTNLEEADLRWSKWEGAYLFKVNLKKGKLGGVSLRNANFWECNLEGAKVQDEILAEANRLRGCILPDGRIYNGRFNLDGDIKDAIEDGIDIENATSMADWYLVPLEDYLSGQKINEDS